MRRHARHPAAIEVRCLRIIAVAKNKGCTEREQTGYAECGNGFVSGSRRSGRGRCGSGFGSRGDSCFTGITVITGFICFGRCSRNSSTKYRRDKCRRVGDGTDRDIAGGIERQSDIAVRIGGERSLFAVDGNERRRGLIGKVDMSFSVRLSPCVRPSLVC